MPNQVVTSKPIDVYGDMYFKDPKITADVSLKSNFDTFANTSTLGQLSSDVGVIEAGKLPSTEGDKITAALGEQTKQAGKAQSDQDILEIEKLMTEKGIANHETAADYWQWMKQAATPTPSGYPQPVMSRLGVQDYMKNPVGAARENAAAALAELRKNPKPIGL